MRPRAGRGPCALWGPTDTENEGIHKLRRQRKREGVERYVRRVCPEARGQWGQRPRCRGAGAQGPRGAGAQGPRCQGVQGPRGPGAQGPMGPRGQGVQGPSCSVAQGPRGPRAQRPRGPGAKGSRGPVAQRPRGPEAKGSRGPGPGAHLHEEGWEPNRRWAPQGADSCGALARRRGALVLHLRMLATRGVVLQLPLAILGWRRPRRRWHVLQLQLQLTCWRRRWHVLRAPWAVIGVLCRELLLEGFPADAAIAASAVDLGVPLDDHGRLEASMELI